MLPPCLLVVHDAGRGGEDDVAERTRGHEQVDPVLNLAELDVEAGRDDAALVDPAIELDDNLAGAVVVNLLELVCKDGERWLSAGFSDEQRPPGPDSSDSSG